MFDIAFSEVMIIAVVALIVIGPERLPRVARTLGHLFGRMQRYVNDVKADIQREVELDELRKLKQTVEESARSIENSVSQEFNAAKDEMRGLESLAQAHETQAAAAVTPEGSTAALSGGAASADASAAAAQTVVVPPTESITTAAPTASLQPAPGPASTPPTETKAT